VAEVDIGALYLQALKDVNQREATIRRYSG
jgi:hypothetical protein